jgi:monolysocardiolipin acyltransferase
VRARAARAPRRALTTCAAGFDRMMPEGRAAPWKFLPRPRQHLSVTFGAPIPAARLRAALASADGAGAAPADAVEGAAMEKQPVPDDAGTGRAERADDAETRRVRAALTAVVRDEVERLGWAVSGPLLGKR